MSEAKQRWSENLPVTLPQLAEAQGISYDSARTLARLPGFPRIGRLIWPEDFLRWRSELVQRGQTNPHNRQAAPADKSDESPCWRGSQGAWPPRAARLRELGVK